MISRLALAAALLLTAGLLIAACGDDGNGAGSNAGDEGVACAPSDMQWDAPPDVTIDPSKTYVATIVTEKGNIVVELFSDVTATANNFVFLAREGFYDCSTFHRVIPGFVALDGDPTGTGAGGPGYAIPDEDDGGHLFEAGVMGMAKAGPDTTGSQFFITYAPQPTLDADFTVFGRVIEGMDVLQQLTPRDPAAPNAPPGDLIETVTIEER
ncbi:MAG: peptidylprolyl isomerase [Dehalococcoidia bacterium]|nr:peptidylprolyl isomerase [Dehalococcoidia bacterium]MDZ4278283.1 peptidylprolyl isomerase [Dehalococcoidia bacterium]